MDIGTVLRGLYASEINAGISWLWDGGFDWWVGGDTVENCDAEGTERTVEQVAQAMHEAALKHFPGSVYAKRAKEAPCNFEEKFRRIRVVRDITGCLLVEAKDAIEANGTVEAAVAAIRQRQLRAAFDIEEAGK